MVLASWCPSAANNRRLARVDVMAPPAKNALCVVRKSDPVFLDHGLDEVVRGVNGAISRDVQAIAPEAPHAGGSGRPMSS
jgi:hypothetical protein